jgi:hypothetical protein
VTVTNPSVASHLTVFPGNVGSAPTASNLNFVAGQTVPNLVTVQVGQGGTYGQVKIVLDAGSADVIADVVGYYSGDTGFGGAIGSRFQARAPSRILDSRSGTGGYVSPWTAGKVRDLTLTGEPAGATAVVMNVTVTNPTAAGFGTLYPSGTTRPNPASNVNFVPGQTVPNLVIVPIGANGKVSLYNSAGSTDYIADVVGWYGGTGANEVFTPLAPKRILDSRNGTAFASPWGPGTARSLSVTALSSGVPFWAVAVVMNVTATNPTAATFVTVYPADPRPIPASNLNVVAGQTVPNLAMVQVGPSDTVKLYNNAGTVDLIADVAGYFAVG